MPSKCLWMFSARNSSFIELPCSFRMEWIRDFVLNRRQYFSVRSGADPHRSGGQVLTILLLLDDFCFFLEFVKKTLYALCPPLRNQFIFDGLADRFERQGFCRGPGRHSGGVEN